MSRSAEAELPVTADDLDQAVQLAVTTLREVSPEEWERKAGSLEWDCWETVEHLSDDLFTYATQLGPRKPPMSGEVPFSCEHRRSGGPELAICADRSAGSDGLLQVLEASGALLVAMVRTTSPRVTAHHVFGASDPEGFAAMGTVETVVHVHDVAEGLGLTWTPPADLCSRVLKRLFPDAPGDTAPWSTLLWATGRAELPGHARLTTWRWDGTPRPQH
nr:maleylpyruvate isomerase N-terminal domain-containing protein [Halosaccharopolyspora lacisalsi]